MSLNFFTSQYTNTLENKLTDILTHYDIENLEFLIGCFKKIASLLDKIEGVCILVGVNVDKFIFDAKNRGKKFNFLDYEKFKDFEIRKEIKKLQEKYSLVHQKTKQKKLIKTNIDIVLSDTFA